jgi:hypothetical protein
MTDIALATTTRPMQPSSRTAFFDRVVAASGLASVIAVPAVRRALIRAGVDPERLTSRDLESALGSLEKALNLYLPTDQAAAQMNALRSLTRSEP